MPHGEWLPFLVRAGMHERQARRLIQLARSGLKSGTVSDLGIKGSLELIAKRKLPTVGGRVLQVSTDHDDDPEKYGGTAWIWESEQHQGYFHVAGAAREFAFMQATRKPITRDCPEMVFSTVDSILGQRPGAMSFGYVAGARPECESFRLAVLDDGDAEGYAERALELITRADLLLAAGDASAQPVGVA